MSKSLLLGLLCAGFGTCAFAAKMCEEFTRPFPGIDEGGNCTYELGADGSAKICINTKGKWRATGKANVQNQSGSTVKITDSATALECIEIDFWLFDDETVTKTLYKVSKGGKAKLSVKGTAPVGG